MKICQTEEIREAREASDLAERLGRRQHIKAKDVSKLDWEAMESDLKWWGGKRASIAGKTLLPTEPPMSPLRSGLHVWCLSLLCHHVLNRAKGEQNGLCAQQMEPVLPEMTTLPIAPKHWARRRWLIGERFMGWGSRGS